MSLQVVIKRGKGTAQFFRESLGNCELKMIRIPAGNFVMGAPEKEEESRSNERPQHVISVPEFCLGQTPITQEQYDAVMGENPSNFKDDSEKWGDALQRPVESVSWDDAQAFCEKLREISGKPYRLPTESEWEYACRAIKGFQPSVSGDRLTKEQERGLIEEWNEKYHQPFHFGETLSTELANYRGTDNESFGWKGNYGRGEKGEYRKQTTSVGMFPANDFGLYDMHGNVWEWCEDDYHESYENAPTDGSAWLKENSREKILRGGSWYSHPGDCRSAYRGRPNRDLRFSNNGFRVAVSPQ